MKKFFQKIAAWFDGLFESPKVENFFTIAIKIVENIKAIVTNPIVDTILGAVIPPGLEQEILTTTIIGLEEALDALELWKIEAAAPPDLESKLQYFITWLKNPNIGQHVKDAINAKLAALIAKIASAKIGVTIPQVVADASANIKYAQIYKAPELPA